MSRFLNNIKHPQNVRSFRFARRGHKFLEDVTDSMRTNQNMYRAWNKAKKYGKLHRIAFVVLAFIPLFKLLCGKGRDYVEKLKKDRFILKLEGPGLEDEEAWFYLPNFEKDLIQKRIVETKYFFERNELANLQRYIRNGDVCLDIGANIGNHAIYYAKICHASKIFAFEPVQSTFAILKKNIELNQLENCIEALNVGLSDRKKSASIFHFEEENIGATQLTENKKGNLHLIALDDMYFPGAIDYIKIDVEGMEYDLLRGAKTFFPKHNPVVYIEVWKENFEKVNSLFQEYGYFIIEKRPADNYIYRRK